MGGNIGKTAPASPAAPGTTPTTQPGANPNSTSNPNPEDVALLERLKPMGITSLGQLKGKTDLELHSIAGDVLAHETRIAGLQKWFHQNPDGSFDFTKASDGRPSGLDAAGKLIPPPGTAPVAGAPPAGAPPAGAPPAGAPPGAPPASTPAPAAKPALSAAAQKAADLAAIKKRATATLGHVPTAAAILATYNRNQARKIKAGKA